MQSDFSNYFCQKLIPILSQKQRFSLWKRFKSEIVFFSCSPQATYCVQLLMSQNSSLEEQLKIMKILQDNDDLCEIATNKHGTHVLIKIISEFKDEAKSTLIDFLYDNILYLSKNKYGISLVKKYLESNDESFELISIISDDLHSYAVDENAHYIELYVLEQNKNNYQILMNNIFLYMTEFITSK